MSRPSSYTKEVGDFICQEIATSNQSLRTICKPEGMPDVSTFYRWVETIEGFREQYARAKEDQADFLFEEIIEIADESNADYEIEHTDSGPKVVFSGENVQRSRLKVEARKWAASKLKPKKYGDRIETAHSGTLEIKGIAELLAGAHD